MLWRFFLILWLSLTFFACVSLFSKEVMKEIDSELTFRTLIEAPEEYVGRVIIVGGKIIRTDLEEGKTWIEILQQPLDWLKRPKETDETSGRYLAKFGDFRDPAIYSPGRKITIIGQVSGKKRLLINEKEYQYPVLKVKESHLWEGEGGKKLFFHLGIGLGGTF